MRVLPGKSYPLGATWDGRGVNFAIYSEQATAVELCLFDSVDSARESHRIPLIERTDLVWHCYIPEARPGTLYGYRVYGEYDPKSGNRFNPNKILSDPYAKLIARSPIWHPSLYAYRRDDLRNREVLEKEILVMDQRDNAPYAPLSEVVDTSFTWGFDRQLQIPWNETIIYEVHIKNITANHPEIPRELRGTYAGFASEPIVRHLKDLGITAVELLPVHHHVDSQRLFTLGMTDYWGYNTLSYFAPDTKFAREGAITETVRDFKIMVKTLHDAGIEVILDVVYNHTCEESHSGPNLSFRGIDNLSYYRLQKDNLMFYEDFTGCGNTLNMTNPRVLQLIMDSLRYWVTEMHVDGFRFDLASTLARELYDVNKLGAFFDIIHQDPIISQVKLIAEPWDLGEGGYQVGNFPVLWTEWNGNYRDNMRKFWRGDSHVLSETATRIAGSSDLYESSGKRPYASINFITCHDGFTLQDMVSYEKKHNEANQENNRDGWDHNYSFNCGAEGPSSDLHVHALRERQKRNLFTTLLISQGVPLISGGDELSRTQQGNNNSYCQDNKINYYNWRMDDSQRLFLKFAKQLIQFRKDNGVLRRRHFFQGRPIRGTMVKDILWLSNSGVEMEDEEWNSGDVRWLGVLLPVDAVTETDLFGQKVHGNTLLIFINSSDQEIDFKIPQYMESDHWKRIFDTWDLVFDESRQIFLHESFYKMRPKTLAVFENYREDKKGNS